jgi:Zn finger protein HypA/HybF involved in hydrogenase expression
MAVANCPSCGGPIEFKVGSSVVLICDHCRSIVARTDRGFEDLGKVAALVDTGSPLRRDLPGKIRGNGFRITGRTQMRHPLGGTWDEWYAAFDDGRWGWIAEAQGKYYLTFKTEKGKLPPYEVLQIGGLLDGLKVVELASATVISGEGEIPFRVEPGDTYNYADLSGPNRRFGTIDYSEDVPLLFEGEETSLADLGINIDLEPGRETRVRVTKLACSQCGGPLTLVAPDQTERVICPQCGASHDVNEGNLRYLKTLKKHGPQPRIALGSNGTVGGEAYVIAGYMQRSVSFDKKYFWNEYLLFAPRTKSFAWLVDDSDHWSFVLPMTAGDVEDGQPGGAATRITSQGKTFAIFQDSVATVESVIGEFYWKVETGEKARAVDYIAPPEGITKEISDTASSHEVNYSLARYMPPEEVESAFNVTGLPRPSTLGTLQPLPPRAGCGALGGMWAAFVILFLLASLLLSKSLPNRDVLADSYHLDQYAASGDQTTTGAAPSSTSANGSQTAGGDWSGGTGTSPTTTDTSSQTTTTTAPSGSSDRSEVSAVIFSKPFVVEGGHNLVVRASTQLSETWLHIDGNLFNEESGLVEPFQMQLEHYEGVEDGEKWTEGSLNESKTFGTLKPGTYSLRLETWRDATKPAPTLDVTATEGVFGTSGCVFLLIALALITIPILIRGMSNRGHTESERWADAMFTPQGELNE